jgi:hypothetical protein
MAGHGAVALNRERIMVFHSREKKVQNKLELVGKN